MNEIISKPKLSILIEADGFDPEILTRLEHTYEISVSARDKIEELEKTGTLILSFSENGLSFLSNGQKLHGDFTRMIPRLKKQNLTQELLVRAAKIKDCEGPFTAIDGTAGLGDDSLLLAAAGFQVTMFERNPIIFELLSDTVRRSKEIPELAPVAERMHLVLQDSIDAMKTLPAAPDVILLDPMFPERQKSALVKKKLQMIQKLESPCTDETILIQTAMEAAPKKLIIKRPPKGPYLAGIKPDYSTEGKAVRFDCFVSPYSRIQKFHFSLKSSAEDQ